MRRRYLCLAFAIITSLGFSPIHSASAATSTSIAAIGAAPSLGATGLDDRPVDLASSPSGNGYWVLHANGSIHSFGDAPYMGGPNTAGLRAGAVAMAALPNGLGYWIVASDGGVFSYGAAGFFGSRVSTETKTPIIDIAATPSGRGYLLLGADGGVFSYGDAPFLGSAVGASFRDPVALAARSDGAGYWILSSDGSVYSFGTSPYFGGANGFASAPMTAIAASPTGNGYKLLARDGAVYSFGDATFHGRADAGTNKALAVAGRPSGDGEWVLIADTPARVPGAPPANSGNGRRIVYSNSGQRVWLVQDDGSLFATYLVSGRRGEPGPGTYHVFGKSASGSAHSGTLRLPYMTRFAHGSTLAIGFHGIPLRRNGTPIQSDTELGQFRSAGCVRQNQTQARMLFDWAPIGTTVVVLA